MIKEAIKRDHPELERIWVDKEQVRLTDPGANVIYTFQMAALGKAVMLVWDNGEMVQPFDLWLRNPVVRERVAKNGTQAPKANESHAKKHLGPILRPKTKEARALRGRDRIFGQKLWTTELAKVRRIFEPDSAVPTESQS